MSLGGLMFTEIGTFIWLRYYYLYPFVLVIDGTACVGQF